MDYKDFRQLRPGNSIVGGVVRHVERRGVSLELDKFTIPYKELEGSTEIHQYMRYNPAFISHQDLNHSYKIEVDKNRNLIITHNDGDRWYVFLMQWDLPNRSANDLVLLSPDYKYVHQIQNLYVDLTGREIASVRSHIFIKDPKIIKL